MRQLASQYPSDPLSVCPSVSPNVTLPWNLLLGAHKKKPKRESKFYSHVTKISGPLHEDQVLFYFRQAKFLIRALLCNTYVFTLFSVTCSSIIRNKHAVAFPLQARLSNYAVRTFPNFFISYSNVLVGIRLNGDTWYQYRFFHEFYGLSHIFESLLLSKWSTKFSYVLSLRAFTRHNK